LIQITVIKLYDYGKWTLTLGQDREHQLQMFQASLYNEAQKLFSVKNSLVFLNRSDELFAVTNKLNLEDHLLIQKKLRTIFNNPLSMSIGYSKNPFDANIHAFESEQAHIILNQDYMIYGSINTTTNNDDVTIIHFDIEDFTSVKKKQTPYETSSLIFELYHVMSKFFMKQKSLSFFMGGDNFMVLSHSDYKKQASEFINMIRQKYELILNCGIGKGSTARDAAKHATQSLDMIRTIRNSGEKKPSIYEF